MVKRKKPAKAGTVVYCGPTIPGVAKQYTAYTNGIGAALEAAAEQKPALRGLIVPIYELPDAMRQLRERDGRIYRLFAAVTAGK